MKELLAFWRRPMDFMEAEATEEAPAQAPAEAEAEAVATETEPAEVTAAVENEDNEKNEKNEKNEENEENALNEEFVLEEDVERKEEEAVPTVGDTIVITEGYESREDFHTLWLQGLSSYLLGIRETLQEAS